MTGEEAKEASAEPETGVASPDEGDKEFILETSAAPESASPRLYKDIEKDSAAAIKSLSDEEAAGIIGMRKEWSTCILACICGIVVFDMLLVTFYGLGVWSFANEKIVSIVIIDNFLKIFGLGFLITKSVFEKLFPNR